LNRGISGPAQTAIPDFMSSTSGPSGKMIGQIKREITQPGYRTNIFHSRHTTAHRARSPAACGSSSRE